MPSSGLTAGFGEVRGREEGRKGGINSAERSGLVRGAGGKCEVGDMLVRSGGIEGGVLLGMRGGGGRVAYTVSIACSGGGFVVVLQWEVRGEEGDWGCGRFTGGFAVVGGGINQGGERGVVVEQGWLVRAPRRCWWRGAVRS